MPGAEHTVEHTEVYHVGDLSVTRDRPRYSNEGRGLSVSLHPDAWRRIARDVNGETYELTNTDGLFYEADPAGPREEVVEWCVANGYVERVQAWKGVWEDVEAGETRHIISYDEETARVESQADVVPDAHVEEVTALTLAEKGREYWRKAFTLEPDGAEPLQVRELLPVWYARGALDVDGVWWPERLDPANYSAPRGVIFQDRLDSWTVRPNP